jgi:PKD repeat protein
MFNARAHGAEHMVRAFRALALLLTVTLAAACSVKDTPAPALSGPSELALSLTMAATPDILSLDGSSQSQVIVIARDASGKAVPNVSLRLDTSIGGAIIDYGTLSSKTIVTGGDGRALALYTAPRASAVSEQPGTTLTVLATPVGSNYANSTARSVDIQLVAPGVITGPNDLTVAFTFAPVSPTANETVVFTSPTCVGTSTTDCTSASVTSWSWTFGDGGTASGKDVTHSFAAGNYPVTLTVKDSLNHAVSTTKTVTVKLSDAPNAAFVVSPSSAIPGQTLFFNAAASSAAGTRTIVDYQWNFGDGATGRGVTSSHAFAAVGSYTVTLTVVDDAGRSATATNTVTVSATGASSPVAKITYSPTSPVHGAAVNFSAADSTSSSTIDSYMWDFGDGHSGFGLGTSHVFAAAGSYVVRVTITDTAGRTATTTVTVTVS